METIYLRMFNVLSGKRGLMEILLLLRESCQRCLLHQHWHLPHWEMTSQKHRLQSSFQTVLDAALERRSKCCLSSRIFSWYTYVLIGMGIDKLTSDTMRQPESALTSLSTPSLVVEVRPLRMTDCFHFSCLFISVSSCCEQKIKIKYAGEGWLIIEKLWVDFFYFFFRARQIIIQLFLWSSSCLLMFEDTSYTI